MNAYITQNGLQDRDIHEHVKVLLGQIAPTDVSFSTNDLWSLHNVFYGEDWWALLDAHKYKLAETLNAVKQAVVDYPQWASSVPEYISKTLSLGDEPAIVWSVEGLRGLASL